MKSFVKHNIYVGTECMNMPELQDKNPMLASIQRLQCKYPDIEVIIGQEYHQAVSPIELLITQKTSGNDNSPEDVRKNFLRGTHASLYKINWQYSAVTSRKLWIVSSFTRFVKARSIFSVPLGLCVRSHRTRTSFVFDRALFAPRKALSKPKLGLQSALLAKRLKIESMKTLTVKVNDIFMWTDGATALQWPKSNDRLPVHPLER